MKKARLLDFNKNEKGRMIIAYVACIFMGVTGPLFAVYLAEFIGILEAKQSNLMEQSAWIGLKFLILGCVLFFISSIQHYQFTFIRQKLTMRLKKNTLKKLLYI